MPVRWKLALGIAAFAASGAMVRNAWAGGGEPPAALPLKEIMAHVMQRNAVQLWSWTTYLSDEKGDRYTAPRTDAEWEDAESDALTLVQIARGLKVADRRLDDQWDRYIGDLEMAALQSAAAAENHDFEGMLKSANAIDARCVACHMHYVPELEGAPAVGRARQ